jgi:hypothetical protein
MEEYFSAEIDAKINAITQQPEQNIDAELVPPAFQNLPELEIDTKIRTMIDFTLCECGGTGTILEDKCDGKGMKAIPCPTCNGKGEA